MAVAVVARHHFANRKWPIYQKVAYWPRSHLLHQWAWIILAHSKLRKEIWCHLHLPSNLGRTYRNCTQFRHGLILVGFTTLYGRHFFPCTQKSFSIAQEPEGVKYARSTRTTGQTSPAASESCVMPCWSGIRKRYTMLFCRKTSGGPSALHMVLTLGVFGRGASEPFGKSYKLGCESKSQMTKVWPP